MEAGYSLEDMRLALKAFAERRHEELAFDRDREPSWLAKLMRKIAWGGFASFIGVAGIVVLFPAARDVMKNWMFVTPMLVALGGAVLSHLEPGIRLPSRDPVADRRSRLWSGWFGRMTAKFAGWRLKRRTVAAELTYRPTEMAIGLAADALFESLPKEQRRGLKELPAVMEALQHDATAMRR